MVESLKQGKLSKEQIEALEGGYDEDVKMTEEDDTKQKEAI